jgi:hypothetical protein
VFVRLRLRGARCAQHAVVARRGAALAAINQAVRRLVPEEFKLPGDNLEVSYRMDTP